MPRPPEVAAGSRALAREANVERLTIEYALVDANLDGLEGDARPIVVVAGSTSDRAINASERSRPWAPSRRSESIAA